MDTAQQKVELQKQVKEKTNKLLAAIMQVTDQIPGADVKRGVDPLSQVNIKDASGKEITLRQLLESCALVHNASAADDCACLPVVKFNLSGNASAVAKHIQDAQAAGYPKKLQRDTDETRRKARRGQVCPSSGPKKPCPAPPPASPTDDSCDEYPFASTWQGGIYMGKPASVRCVPRGTNSSQGGTLGNFYTNTPIKDKDWFCVEIVP